VVVKGEIYICRMVIDEKRRCWGWESGRWIGREGEDSNTIKTRVENRLKRGGIRTGRGDDEPKQVNDEGE